MKASPAGTAAPIKGTSDIKATQDKISFVSNTDLPFVAWYKPPADQVQSTKPLQVGDLCPNCQTGRLDYDGTLSLTCNQCGYALSGGAGCT